MTTTIKSPMGLNYNPDNEATKIAVLLAGTINALEDKFSNKTVCIFEQGIWGFVLYPLFTDVYKEPDCKFFKFVDEIDNISEGIECRYGKFVHVNCPTDYLAPRHLYHEIIMLLNIKKMVFGNATHILCMAYYKRGSNEFSDFQFGLTGTKKVIYECGNNTILESDKNACIREIKEETGVESLGRISINKIGFIYPGKNKVPTGVYYCKL